LKITVEGEEEEQQQSVIESRKEPTPSISINQGLGPEPITKKHERNVSKPTSNWEAMQGFVNIIS